ncbi:hypothetical protein BKG77_09875 [Mycobacteroides chelonae]|nr:hypothetical protein BKG77_09875 [Mycobacteroides chelonae]
MSGSDSPTALALTKVASAYLATIRAEFGSFGRQVSGYALEHLASERGFDIRRMLAGSEGSLAVITEATVQLVRNPAHAILVVLEFPDVASAGDGTPHLLCFGADRRPKLGWCWDRNPQTWLGTASCGGRITP